MTLTRREVLGGLFASVALSPLSRAAPAVGARPPLTLIMLELKGGNDGLQMVCPITDPLYRRLRPDLALDAKSCSAFDRGLALHEGFAPLRSAVDAGELCVVGDVGYKEPNRSHFRAIQIWDHASTANEVRDEGWLTRALSTARVEGSLRETSLALDGVIVRGDDGPLEGARTLHLAGGAPKAQKRRQRVHAPESGLTKSARHIEETRVLYAKQTSALATRLATVAVPQAGPALPTKIEAVVDLAVRASILAARGEGVAHAVKLTLPGFDTHTNQRQVQDRLLGELGTGLAALRARLAEAGAWDRTVVVVMSEFGRRVAQNNNGGTDHGAAGPLLVLGGAVRGGLVGAPPRLDDLLDGDLRVRVEHRDVFASVARRAFGLSNAGLTSALSSTATLPLFRV